MSGASKSCLSFEIKIKGEENKMPDLIVQYELFMGVQSKTKELFHYYEIPFPRDTIGTKPEIKIENQKITLIL